MSCFVQRDIDIITEKNECVFYIQIEHEFVVVFIAFYTYDVDLTDFCRFTLGTILYKKVVPAM